ncbi:FixH family protein [Geomicrobium sp. JCM 19037]|uniref:FixH family protein n=1 Tax=Geomicrobium sp. JCM 19037 TaxID=1460634 RepID=UPI0005AB7EB7|nr:FixH family protein [Geomicrobium sp. JCM 19037]
MRRGMIVGFLLVMLSGCSMVERFVDANNHDDYNDRARLVVDMMTNEIVTANEQQRLSVQVTADYIPVVDAEHVGIRIWPVLAGEEEADEYELFHHTMGVYETEVEVSREGLYYAEAVVEINDQKLRPKKYFAVGRLYQEEVLLLMENGSEESGNEDHSAHH